MEIRPKTIMRSWSQSQRSYKIDTVVSDFNGTISKKDLAKLVLARFAEPGWKKYDELFAAGKISFRQCFQNEYSLLEAKSKREILNLIRNDCELRKGFKEFSQICSKSKIRIIVASKGLDFMVQHVFEVNEIGTPLLYCPKAKLSSKGGKWQISFPELPRGFHNFKESLVSSLKTKGHSVAFVGDDAYDFWAAKRSDLVFAVRGSSLEEECRSRNLPHVSFVSFTELKSRIKQS